MPILNGSHERVISVTPQYTSYQVAGIDNHQCVRICVKLNSAYWAGKERGNLEKQLEEMVRVKG